MLSSSAELWAPSNSITDLGTDAFREEILCSTMWCACGAAAPAPTRTTGACSSCPVASKLSPCRTHQGRVRDTIGCAVVLDGDLPIQGRSPGAAIRVTRASGPVPSLPGRRLLSR